MGTSDNTIDITVKVSPDNSGFAKARALAAAAGADTGDAFVKGADGPLRDAKDRFTKAGDDAGDGFSGGLKRGIGDVGGAATSAASGLATLGVGAAILGWAPAAAAALVDLTGVLGVLPAAAGAGAAVLGTFKLALSGVAEAISAQGGVAAGAAKTGASAAAMARQIRDAVDSVNDARQAAARVAEDSARRIQDAERNTARVARDGAEAIAAAKARVAEAAQDTADAVAEANQQLADTEEQVARQIADAEKALDDARRQAARTVERTARSGADAVANAADRVAKALEREQDAQDSLSQARQDAARDLEDLQAKVAGYAADEQSAQARVSRAAEELRKVNASRRFSDVDRQEAAAELAQAEQHLADIQREGKQDAADLAKVQTQGLDATKRVQDAAERVADAHEAVVDATNDRAKAEQDAAEANAEAAQSAAESVADAQDRVTQAREDGARRIQDAEEAVAKAAEDGAKRQAEAKAALARTERDASEANQDAARAEADARREAAQAQSDAAERVADAEQRLNDTYAQQREQAAQAAASTDTYAAALAKLSPNARAFVEQIRALRPEWEALTRSVQDAAFAGLAAQVAALAGTYFPVLRAGLTGIASDLNAMAIYAAQALMTPESVAAVNAVLAFTRQFLQEARTALGDFLAGFLILMQIGASYLPQFGAWLADIAARFREWIDTQAGRDQIVEWINRAFTNFGLLWQILQNVWAAVSSVVSALGGGSSGVGLLQMLVQLSANLAAVAARKDTQALLQAIGDVARFCLGIMIQWAPQILAVVAALVAVNGIASAVAAVIGVVNGVMVAVRAATVAWTAVQWLLNAALSANPIGLVVIAITALVAALIYVWNTNEGFRNAVIGAWNAIVAAARTVSNAVGAAFNGIWNGLTAGAKGAANGAIGVLNGLIDAANWAIRAVNAVTGASFTQFGHFPYLAKGGIAGGMAVVGENGPELVKLPQGSTVYPAGQSKGMADKLGGGSGGAVRVEIVFAGNTDGVYASGFQKLLRTGQIQIRQSQLVAG